MSIDLSKAKIGDKFRTKDGQILAYIGKEGNIDAYKLMDETHSVFYYHEKGNFLLFKESHFDLIEQVFEKPLDEIIEEGTKQFRESGDAIAEENELQRRQEVVELAEKMLLSESIHRSYLSYTREKLYNGSECVTSFHAYILTAAEDFINYKNEYLKNGSYGNKHLCKD